MLKRLIYYILERRHHWRQLTFSEVAELYASRTLRVFALSMVTVFVGIYLYKNGYSVTFIMLYFAGYFLFRALLAIPLSHVIARIGPKHTSLISNFLYVPALLLLVTVPDHGLPALLAAGFFQAISVTLYDIAYLVDFSKVKHDEHAGKELSYMHMLEQVAKGLSPVIGGFIAYWAGPQVTLFVAAVVFALAALPLFFTPEPIKTRQQITFRGLPWHLITKNLVSEAAIGADIIASTILWSLLIAIGIFGTDGNAIYAQIGVLSAVTVLVGIASARIFGLLVDHRRANELLKTSVIVDSLTHIGRVMVATPFGVVLINIINEIATTGYVIPYSKAMFMQADNLPGYRIVYMSVMSASAASGAAIMCIAVAGFSLWFDEPTSLQIAYVLAAFIVLLIMRNGFRDLLKPKRIS